MSYLYLGAETTSITPPSSHAPCSCHPFLLKEWLISAIPTGNAQPPHHLYSPCHVSTTVPCQQNLDCTVTWTGDLSWKATQELKEEWKINPATPVVCHTRQWNIKETKLLCWNTKVHVPGRWWSKQLEAREWKHSWERGSSTSPQPKPNG